LLIAVGRDGDGWHDRFLEALGRRAETFPGLSWRSVAIDSSGWLEDLEGCDAVLWKPGHMGAVLASHVKERIFLMERVLGLRVMPSLDTAWHFESKIAQHFLLEASGLPTPRTFVSFDPDEALAAASAWEGPAVVKESHGAASRGVRLVEGGAPLRRHVEKCFRNLLWASGSGRSSMPSRVLGSIGSRWFWSMLGGRLAGRGELFEPVLWQEYVEGNDRDLRVTVVGDRYAAAFWRRNRPGDFRASGSGMIEHSEDFPASALELCARASSELRFDSMAYDVVFRDGAPLILEMSFGYLDSAVHDCPGHFLLERGAPPVFVRGRRWPQELWVDWLLLGSRG